MGKSVRKLFWPSVRRCSDLLPDFVLIFYKNNIELQQEDPSSARRYHNLKWENPLTFYNNMYWFTGKRPSDLKRAYSLILCKRIQKSSWEDLLIYKNIIHKNIIWKKIRRSSVRGFSHILHADFEKIKKKCWPIKKIWWYCVTKTFFIFYEEEL